MVPFNMIRQWMTSQLGLPLKSKHWLFLAFMGPLSLVYGFLSQFRNFLFDSGIMRVEKLPGKTVSVGNIVLGGTGKSPFAIYIAQYLKSKGFSPAIVTRGYRSVLLSNETIVLQNMKFLLKLSDARNRVVQEVSDLKADEAIMYSAALPDVPIIIGRRRSVAVKRFLRELPDVAREVTHWILDDGFQHRSIFRDIDLVLVDAERPLGVGSLLPLGDLRESPRSLKRASAIFFTHAASKTESDADIETSEFAEGIVFNKECPTSHVVFSNDVPTSPHSKKQISPTDFPVFAIAAIARPERFLKALETFDIPVAEKLTLPDHAKLSKKMLAAHGEVCRSIVTTAKDYWRDSSLFSDLPIPVYIFPQKVDVDGNFLSFLFN